MRMPAAKALRKWNCFKSGPASSADDSALVRGKRSLAYDAYSREQKVRDARDRAAHGSQPRLLTPPRSKVHRLSRLVGNGPAHGVAVGLDTEPELE